MTSKSGDLSWLNNAMAEGEDYGFGKIMERTGIFIVGANTYKQMLEQGMAGINNMGPTYVVTREKDLKKGNQTYLYDGDLKKLAEKTKSESDKDICVWGGGNLITQFIDLNLLDELSVSIIPVLLGGGVPLFRELAKPSELMLTDCERFEKSGIVILKYKLH